MDNNVVMENNIRGPNCNVLKAHVWKIKCPPKVKHFIWQVVSGVLAVSKRLQERGIKCDTICQRCGNEDESINHALFLCPHSRQTWALAPICLIRDIFPSESSLTNLDYLFWRTPRIPGKEENLCIFPWILWLLWKARNKKVFRGINSKPQEIVNQALTEFNYWKEAQITQPIGDNCNPGNVIINNERSCQIDGSWKNLGDCSGLGWICSDPENTTVLMGASNQSFCLSALHAELEALVWALKTLRERRIVCTDFKTDCEALITMVECPEDWPSFSNLLDEFVALRDALPKFHISKISRDLNKRADCLARSVRKLSF